MVVVILLFVLPSNPHVVSNEKHVMVVSNTMCWKLTGGIAFVVVHPFFSDHACLDHVILNLHLGLGRCCCFEIVVAHASIYDGLCWHIYAQYFMGYQLVYVPRFGFGFVKAFIGLLHLDSLFFLFIWFDIPHFRSGFLL